MQHQTSGDDDDWATMKIGMMAPSSGRLDDFPAMGMMAPSSGRSNAFSRPASSGSAPTGSFGMLAVSSGRPGGFSTPAAAAGFSFGTPPVLHEGITCDHCHAAPIAGVRYRCSMCVDYDLCAGCYEARAAGSSGMMGTPLHDDTHLFLRIDRTTPQVQGYSTVMNRAAAVHAGVTCAGCRAVGFAGYRYTCTVCDVDLCEACEAKGTHDISHARLKRAAPIAEGGGAPQAAGPAGSLLRQTSAEVQKLKTELGLGVAPAPAPAQPPTTTTTQWQWPAPASQPPPPNAAPRNTAPQAFMMMPTSGRTGGFAGFGPPAASTGCTAGPSTGGRGSPRAGMMRASSGRDGAFGAWPPAAAKPAKPAGQ